MIIMYLEYKRKSKYEEKCVFFGEKMQHSKGWSFGSRTESYHLGIFLCLTAEEP